MSRHLVGTRSVRARADGAFGARPAGQLLRALGRPDPDVDLASEEHQGADDVRRYLTRRLADAGAPGAYDRDDAARLAAVLAERVGDSFLYARLAAEIVLRAPRIRFDEAWESCLPQLAGSDAFAAVVTRDLDRLDGRSRDLLMAVAFAEGSGLPRPRVWPAVASAITGRSYDDDDVARTLDQAAWYLIEASDGGQAVYRLYHEELARHFRQAAAEDVSEGGIQARVTGELRRLVPEGGAGWRHANRYLRDHLAQHASLGGGLGDLVGDVGFVAAADPASLSRVIGAVLSEDGEIGAIARAHLRLGQGSLGFPPDVRAGLLELCAVTEEPAALRLIRTSRRDAPWRTRWAVGRRTPFHRILEGHTGWVSALAFGIVGGHATLASAGADGTVRVWDVATCSTINVLEDGSDGLSGLAFGNVAGRAVIATGGDTVRLWDVVEGSLMAVIDGDAGGVLGVAFGRVGGRDAVISAGHDDGTVRLWDAAAGSPMAVFEGTPDGGPVLGVAFDVVDDRPMIAGGGAGGMVLLWDTVAALPIAILEGHVGPVRDVAFGTVGGRNVVASAGDDGTIRLWDFDARTPIAILSGHHTDGVQGVAFGALGDREVIVSAGLDATVRVWDLAECSPIAVLEGHSGWVHDVAFSDVGGRPVIASAGFDGTVRLWDVAAAPVIGTEEGHAGWVDGVALGGVAGRPVVASAGRDGTVRLSDAATGSNLRALRGHTGEVTCLAFDGGPRIASGGSDGTVRLWDSATGSETQDPERSYQLGCRRLLRVCRRPHGRRRRRPRHDRAALGRHQWLEDRHPERPHRTGARCGVPGRMPRERQ